MDQDGLLAPSSAPPRARRSSCSSPAFVELPLPTMSSPFSSALHPHPLKRTSSQPNLRQSLHPTQLPPPQQHLAQLTPPTLINTAQLPIDQDRALAVTRIPRRCSPRGYRHKRTASMASSIGSAMAHHHHHLFILSRHQSGEEEEEDEVEIEGGMSGLLRAAEEEEQQMMDCALGLDERRASESCGSSAVGEPMAIDSEHATRAPCVGPRMVRRKPVNRANLLPRPKAHLRVAAQLSTEEVSPDLLTEAEVHRRFKSIPFVVPQPASSTPTNTLATTTPSNSPLIPRTPSSPFYHHPHRPTPNRFPEQVDDEHDERRLDDKSSDSDEGDDRQSFCSGPRRSIVSHDEECEDQKMLEIQKWKMFRGSGSSGSSAPVEMNRSGKRRCQESDRYEPGMFKRRAVSPSSASLSSSCIGSPILNPVSVSQLLPVGHGLGPQTSGSLLRAQQVPLAKPDAGPGIEDVPMSNISGS